MTLVPQHIILQSPASNDPLLDLNTQPSLDLQFATSKTLNDRVSGNNLITFSRADATTCATYVDSNGVIQTAAANVPRFDHDPVTGESLGLLIEESRTNLYPISETYTSWNVDNNATITTDGTTIAGLTAIKLTSNVDTNSLFLEGNNATFTANTTYTSSVYHKVGNVDGFWFEARFFSGGGTPKIYFNSSTETWSATSGGTAPAIWSVRSQKVESNAWRHSITFYIGTDTAGTLRMGALAPANSTNVSTGAYGYLAAPQIEAGSFPTSYIPTSASAVTRAADVADITGTNFSSWYNQSEGTVFAEAQAVDAGTGQQLMHTYGASTTSNRGMYYLNNSNRPSAYWVNAGTNQALLQSSTPFAGFEGQAFKYVAAYGTDDFALGYNGGNLRFDTAGTPDPTIYRASIGSFNSASSFLNGHISRLTYYPYRLADATLQEITS